MDNIVHSAELKIPSDPIYLRPVRSFVRELAENMGFCHEKVSGIELAVDEVFSNAIEHGSADLGSEIAIRCLSTDEMIKIIVSDTGRGRNSNTKWIDAWTNVVREKAQLTTERGHGLLLAYDLTDEMTVKSNSIGGVDVHLVIHKEEQQVTKR